MKAESGEKDRETAGVNGEIAELQAEIAVLAQKSQLLMKEAKSETA